MTQAFYAERDALKAALKETPIAFSASDMVRVGFQGWLHVCLLVDDGSYPSSRPVTFVEADGGQGEALVEVRQQSACCDRRPRPLTVPPPFPARSAVQAIIKAVDELPWEPRCTSPLVSFVQHVIQGDGRQTGLESPRRLLAANAPPLPPAAQCSAQSVASRLSMWPRAARRLSARSPRRARRVLPSGRWP